MPSTCSTRSRPKLEALTFAGVKTDSVRFWPVRAISLRYVTTSVGELGCGAGEEDGGGVGAVGALVELGGGSAFCAEELSPPPQAARIEAVRPERAAERRRAYMAKASRPRVFKARIGMHRGELCRILAAVGRRRVSQE